MKKILIVALAAFVLSACADKKKQEESILDSLIKVHDKVMSAD